MSLPPPCVRPCWWYKCLLLFMTEQIQLAIDQILNSVWRVLLSDKQCVSSLSEGSFLFLSYWTERNKFNHFNLQKRLLLENKNLILFSNSPRCLLCIREKRTLHMKLKHHLDICWVNTRTFNLFRLELIKTACLSANRTQDPFRVRIMLRLSPTWYRLLMYEKPLIIFCLISPDFTNKSGLA